MLLASGKAVPISTLKPGEKVVSTSTKTGTTQAGTIAAVLVHHDTNRYDLTVRARGRTAVIHTTSNYPFWDATTGCWVKAGAFRLRHPPAHPIRRHRHRPRRRRAPAPVRLDVRVSAKSWLAVTGLVCDTPM